MRQGVHGAWYSPVSDDSDVSTVYVCEKRIYVRKNTPGYVEIGLLNLRRTCTRRTGPNFHHARISGQSMNLIGVRRPPGIVDDDGESVRRQAFGNGRTDAA